MLKIKLNDDFNEDEFGDRFIREARMQREEEIRLKLIDQKLQEIAEQKTRSAAPIKDLDESVESMSNEENVYMLSFSLYCTVYFDSIIFLIHSIQL